MFDRLLGHVRGNFNVITIIEIIYSIVLFTFAIIFTANASMNLTVLCVLVGLLMIAYGGLSILFYMKKDDIELYNYNMIFGGLMILIGFVSFFARSFLNIMLFIYLLVIGVQRIYYGIMFKKFNEAAWLMTLVIAIMVMIIAFIVVSANEDTICRVTGISFIGFSIFNIVNMLLLRRRSEFFLA